MYNLVTAISVIAIYVTIFYIVIKANKITSKRT